MKKCPLLIDVFIGHFPPKINALLVMFQSQRFISLRFCVFAQKYCSRKRCHVPHARAEELETKKKNENGGGAVTYFDASHKNGTIGIFKPV